LYYQIDDTYYSYVYFIPLVTEVDTFGRFISASFQKHTHTEPMIMLPQASVYFKKRGPADSLSFCADSQTPGFSYSPGYSGGKKLGSKVVYVQQTTGAGTIPHTTT
jgi:hypothetical protein